MKTTLPILLIMVFLAGCGKSLSGTYKLESFTPNLGGLTVPPQLSSMMNKVLEAQQSTLEFGPGKKVEMKTRGMGTEAEYTIEGQTLKIKFSGNQFMEFTIEGNTLIGPSGMRYVKQK